MKRALVILISLTVIIGCKKPDSVPTITTGFVDGFFALNEGLFQQNNASLSFYSSVSKSMTPSVFSSINGRELGDTANDLIRFTFEGKLYYAIAVNVSSQIEILDGLTLHSITQIGLFNDGIGREPRSLQYINGTIYCINFDGTVTLIDMNTLEESKTIAVGNNPESSIIYQNRLFVVNTGGLNYPHYDSTISVIDLQNNTVISEFTSGINGSNLIVDEQGEGYMISRGNYDNIDPKLIRLDLDNYTSLDRYDLNVITMAYENNTIYYYDDLANAIFTFNTETEIEEPSALIDCSDFENVYKIIINQNEQLIYIIDANGYVNSSIIRTYDFNGNFQTEIISGLNTNSIVFTP